MPSLDTMLQVKSRSFPLIVCLNGQSVDLTGWGVVCRRPMDQLLTQHLQRRHVSICSYPRTVYLYVATVCLRLEEYKARSWCAKVEDATLKIIMARTKGSRIRFRCLHGTSCSRHAAMPPRWSERRRRGSVPYDISSGN